MNRKVLVICLVALLGALAHPGFASARDPESKPSAERAEPADSKPPEGREEWREQLLAAHQAVAAARKRSADALSAYQSMRHRNYPRGEAKQAIMDELEASREEVATTTQELEKLEHAARRAGASPSWLEFDPAEIKAAPQSPASQ